MITIGTLFLVIAAVEKSHVVDWLARKTFGTNDSEWIGRLRMYSSSFFLSIFFNNTPLVAILLPVVKDWGRMRGISASQLLMPLSYSVLAGSFGSMIGTSTNLTVQGLMQADRQYSFPFFAPLPIGIICFIALLLYLLIAGPYLLPSDKSGLLRQARDELREYIAEVYVSDYSSAVRKTLSFMMSSLGIAPSLAVKIRRKSTSNSDIETQVNNSEVVTPTFIDSTYTRDFSHFWYSSQKLPRRLSSEDLTGPITVDTEYFDIISPGPQEVIQAGDIVFIASAQDAVDKMLKSILGESKGLYILQGNVMSLPGFGSELVELVVSDSNPFVGQKVSEFSAEFGERYKSGLITLRPKDFGKQLSSENENPPHSVEDNIELLSDNDSADFKQVNIISREDTLSIQAKDLHSNISISDHELQYGDTILAVTTKCNIEELIHNRDFFIVSTVGNLPKPLSWYSLIPVFAFVAMLIVVAGDFIEMCPAALTLTAFFFIGGWIKAHEIPKYVDIRLLMLMGCSLSFAKAMTKSGLATRVAATISGSNPSNFGALLLIYVVTLVITELISNNAAAALMYPIGVALADELKISFKPFAMAVLVASTAGFMSPIGYQTHIMVWGPGGYSFRDFLLFGFIPDVTYWLLGCALAVLLYPF